MLTPILSLSVLPMLAGFQTFLILHQSFAVLALEYLALLSIEFYVHKWANKGWPIDNENNYLFHRSLRDTALYSVDIIYFKKYLRLAADFEPLVCGNCEHSLLLIVMSRGNDHYVVPQPFNFMYCQPLLIQMSSLHATIPNCLPSFLLVTSCLLLLFSSNTLNNKNAILSDHCNCVQLSNGL